MWAGARGSQKQFPSPTYMAASVWASLAGVRVARSLSVSIARCAVCCAVPGSALRVCHTHTHTDTT